MRAGLGMAGRLSTTPKWGSPAMCPFPTAQNVINLFGLFFALTFNAERQAGKLLNINFKVIGLTRLRIKLKSTAP